MLLGGPETWVRSRFTLDLPQTLDFHWRLDVEQEIQLHFSKIKLSMSEAVIREYPQPQAALVLLAHIFNLRSAWLMAAVMALALHHQPRFVRLRPLPVQHLIR